jgi:hypothetical protein
MTCCAVGKIDILTHSKCQLEINASSLDASHTITCYWNKLCQSLNSLTMDTIEGSGNAPCQSRANHMVVILVFSIQQTKCVFHLEELTEYY